MTGDAAAADDPRGPPAIEAREVFKIFKTRSSRGGAVAGRFAAGRAGVLRQLQAVILGEAVVVIVVSIAVGALLGAPMAYMFVQILRRIFVVPPTELAVPSSQVLLLAGLLLLTVTFSAIIIAAAIRRLRLLERLRTK